MQGNWRRILHPLVASKMRVALVALGVASVVLMILDVQHNLAYVGVRIAAIALAAEAIRDARERQQRRGRGEDVRGIRITKHEAVVAAAVLVIAVMGGLMLLG